MVNRVFLIGRLGRDPELRYTSSGTPVANFSLATSERRGSEEQTEWHNIVAWAKLAEICSQYLKKGRLIFIEGRIQTREWDDKDGNKRRTTEIVANNMQMLESKSAAQSEGPGRSEPSEAPMEVGITDDDIPF